MARSVVRPCARPDWPGQPDPSSVVDPFPSCSLALPCSEVDGADCGTFPAPGCNCTLRCLSLVWRMSAISWVDMSSSSNITSTFGIFPAAGPAPDRTAAGLAVVRAARRDRVKWMAAVRACPGSCHARNASDVAVGVGHHLAGDGVQPAGEARLGAEAGHLAADHQEDFLNRVLDFDVRAAQVPGPACHGLAVVAVSLRQG